MAVTASEARRDLFPLIGRVNRDRAPAEITSGRGGAVPIGADDDRALEETACLLRSPADARHPPGRIAAAREGATGSTSSIGEAGLHRPRLGRPPVRQVTDGAMLGRLNRLLDDVVRDPLGGLGRPEPPRHALSGTWSRRIDQ